jgi:hypothetical protein
MICGEGLLVIWSDIASELETDYLNWLTREHTSERVTTEGFRSVRVFRALLPGKCRYLIVYELEGPDVLDGKDYVTKLNNPTPWSQRIMPNLSNFMRGGGRLLACAGTGQGGVLAAITVDECFPPDISTMIADLARCDRVTTIRLVETDQAKTSIETREKRLRKYDRTFARLILIEGIDEAAITVSVDRLASTAKSLVPNPGDVLLFKQVFSLNRMDLQNSDGKRKTALGDSETKP